jgi:hypothetical protein
MKPGGNDDVVDATRVPRISWGPSWPLDLIRWTAASPMATAGQDAGASSFIRSSAADVEPFAFD